MFEADGLVISAFTTQEDAFAGRVGASLLKAVGLPELIAHSADEYEAIALRLARDSFELASLRQKLAANRQTQALFDTNRFRRHLEAAFVTMWERNEKGLTPESFAVEAIS